MIWLFLYFTSIIFVCYLFYLIGIKYNYVRKIYWASKLPGPPALPIIGNGLLFINKSAVEMFSTILKICKDYPDISRVWIGPDLNILLTNPKDVEILLSSPNFIEKADEYKFIKPWLNEGLLISESKKWYKRRKILTPAFHFKILEQFIEIFDRNSEILMEQLSKLPTDNGNGKIELYPIITLYALDVICESSMGVSVNAQKNANSDYVKAVKQMAHVLHLRMLDCFLRMDICFKFTSLAKEQCKSLKILHGFTDKVILDRREEILKNKKSTFNLENDNSNNVGDEIIGEKRKLAFLDILLQSTIDGKPLTNLEIREEVDTFMFEGHDTTTSGITFCLYNLAKYPEIQEICFQEIRKIVGNDKKKSITLNELNNLHYLELVIKESLRLFPSVPLIGRCLQDTVTINNNTLPIGANVIIPIHFMGRRADIFSNPEQFIPERFETLERGGDKVNPFAYIPFSAGPRNCIGQKFAMLEMKNVIMKMLRYYRLNLAADSLKEPSLTAELILVPGNQINFHLIERVYD